MVCSAMAFANQGGNADMLTNPLLGYYAEQSLAHAQRNPSDMGAMMHAHHYANLLAQQRQLQAAQQAL